MERIIQIDYMRCLKALLRKLPLALLVAFAFGIAGAICSYFFLDSNDEYTARASVYTRTTNEYGNAAEGVQYAELAKSLTVAERALEIMGTGATVTKYEVYDMIEVRYDNENAYVNSSAVISLYATHTDPQTAINVINAVAQAFVAEVTYIVKEDTQISVLDQASVAAVTYQAQQQFWMVTGLAALAGFILVCIIVVLREILSLRLNTVADGTLYGKLAIIGVIPDNTEA